MSEVELRGRDTVERGQDDLDSFLDEELRDPEFRGAYEDAMARSALLHALVRRRGECRLSQADVASRMGTTQSAVSDLERGAADPRLSTLQRFARAINCELHVLLQADQPQRGQWLVVREQVLRLVQPAVAPAGFWEPLLTYLAGAGRARPTPLGAPPTTRVAPVELRAEPDEFALAAIK
jgi:transcriptional regulator with XRE-family HTH domain